MKDSRCALCNGKLERKKVTVDKIRNNKIYLFEDITALVCADCGEIWFSGETAEWMEQVILNKIKSKKKISVPVFSEKVSY